MSTERDYLIIGSGGGGSAAAYALTRDNGKMLPIEKARVMLVESSVLPRESRVNLALTIYTWGLRVGRHLRTGGTS